MAPESSKKSKTDKTSKAEGNSTATNDATANSNPAPNDNSDTSDDADTSNDALVPATSAAPINRARTLNEMLNIMPTIQEAVIREGQLDRRDIETLRMEGMHIQLPERILRLYRGDEGNECHVRIVDHQCPSTSITYGGRFQPCDGARVHRGMLPGILWNHRAQIYTLLPMPPLVRQVDPLLLAQLPPPPPFENQNGVHPPWAGPSFQVCEACIQHGRNFQRNPRRRRFWSTCWVPYCMTHSDRIARTWGNGQAQHDGVGPIPCRCDSDVNGGWVCPDHRTHTAVDITWRASTHKRWMRQLHFRGASRIHDPQRPMNKWPSCPYHIDCAEKLWRTTRVRYAKCLACGGLVRCRGKLGYLSRA